MTKGDLVFIYDAVKLVLEEVQEDLADLDGEAIEQMKDAFEILQAELDNIGELPLKEVMYDSAEDTDL